MGVYFIGNDDLLALVRVVFADAGAGEEGFAVDVGRLSGLLGGLTVGAGAAIGVLLLVVGIALFNGDSESGAGYFFAVDATAGATDVECAFYVGQQDIGEPRSGGLGHLSVDDGDTALGGGIGSGEDRQALE